MHINCAQAAAMCTEVASSENVFGHYVGHDEPSMLFFSHENGSGNHMSYNVTLPTEPTAADPNPIGRLGRPPSVRSAASRCSSCGCRTVLVREGHSTLAWPT